MRNDGKGMSCSRSDTSKGIVTKMNYRDFSPDNTCTGCKTFAVFCKFVIVLQEVFCLDEKINSSRTISS